MRCYHAPAALLTVAIVACASLLHADAWQARNSGVTKDLRGVCFGNGRYLAVGMDGTAVLSADGANWSALPPFTAADLRGVAFGNNAFVAVAGFGNNEIWRSVNGSDWTQVLAPVSSVLNQVRFLNNRFVIVGNNRTILASADGLTWETWAQGDNYAERLYDAAHGNGTYVAVGKNLEGASFITRSTDGGQTWRSSDNTIPTGLNGVAFGSGLFVAAGGHAAGQGLLMTSPDGQNWTVRTSTYEYMLEKVNFQAGLFAALSSAIVLSPDGLQWSQQATPQKPYYDLCEGQGKLLAVGYRGAVLQSDPVKLGPTLLANGCGGTVSLDPGEGLILAVVTRGGQYENAEADWWVLAAPEGHSRWYYRDRSGLWPEIPAGDLNACQPAYQGPLATLADPVTVLPPLALPSGSYLFYFILDRRDGVLNYPDALLDAVRVIVP